MVTERAEAGDGAEPAESMSSTGSRAARAAAGRLLDMHCHGAVGAEFGGSIDGSQRAAQFFGSHGITVFASLVSAPADVLTAQVAVLGRLVAQGEVAGIHLEGPFLSARRCGAHARAALVPPDPALIERLVQQAADVGAPGSIRQLTFAPELPEADRLIQTLADLGIVPAIGHTDADAATVTWAIEQVLGVTGRPPVITHLFNAMPPFHHRNGGPVTAALSAARRGEAVVELIADGVHVAPEVIRMVFETVPSSQIALVSDAMPATGLGDGHYRLGSLRVQVVEGTARLVTHDGSLGSIAGGSSCLADCLAWAIDVAGVDPDDASRAATSTPRGVFGLSERSPSVVDRSDRSPGAPRG